MVVSLYLIGTLFALIMLIKLNLFTPMTTLNSANNINININAQFKRDIEQIYFKNYHWLVSKIRKKLSCPHKSADIAQDTFLKLLNKKSVSDIIEPRAYLSTIAHGLVANHFRRQDIEIAYLAALESLGFSQQNLYDSPETLALAIEKLITIDLMLEGLPSKVRMAFLMHKLDGLSYYEIAVKMNLSVISIKKYIARALLHCASER